MQTSPMTLVRARLNESSGFFPTTMNANKQNWYDIHPYLSTNMSMRLHYDNSHKAQGMYNWYHFHAVLKLTRGSIATIQAENARRIQHQEYRDFDTRMSATANHRYEILPSDFSRLYRRYYRSQGINVDIKPEININNWLDPTSPSFHPTLAQAVFHYTPRTDKTERFELCISTPEMRSAAIDLVHQKQLVLDGTFGLSTSRLLLWIAMGVDGGNHGVPVAFFLFSAPSGTKATHAGYNTSILTKLLEIGRAHV